LPKFGRETGSGFPSNLSGGFTETSNQAGSRSMLPFSPTIIDDLIKSGKIDTKSRSIIAQLGRE
jgi:hypothetical protein